MGAKPMGTGLVLALLVASACSGGGGNPPPPDALPACSELPGCEAAVCRADDVCRCLRPGQDPVDCRRVALPPSGPPPTGCLDCPPPACSGPNPPIDCPRDAGVDGR